MPQQLLDGTNVRPAPGGNERRTSNIQLRTSNSRLARLALPLLGGLDAAHEDAAQVSGKIIQWAGYADRLRKALKAGRLDYDPNDAAPDGARMGGRNTAASQAIQRAFSPAASLAQDVGIDHRRGHVIVAQQLLNGANVRPASAGNERRTSNIQLRTSNSRLARLALPLLGGLNAAQRVSRRWSSCCRRGID